MTETTYSLGNRIWCAIVTGAAWIGGALLVLAVAAGCVLNVKEGNRLGDAEYECRHAGNRVELYTDGSGWLDQVDCFDRDTGELLDSTRD